MNTVKSCIKEVPESGDLNLIAKLERDGILYLYSRSYSCF